MKYPVRIPVWFIVPLVVVAAAFLLIGRDTAPRPVAAAQAPTTTTVTVTSVQTSVLTVASVQTSVLTVPSLATSVVTVPVTVTASAALAAAAVPTATPMPVVPTQQPAAATPAPKSGTTLYAADWSKGMNGWGGTGWKVLEGMLLNDGSNVDSGTWKPTWIHAPYQPTAMDYAVEAEAQVVQPPDCGSFGIVVRSGYEAGVHLCGTPTLSLRSAKNDEIMNRQENPGTGWHAYRVEARGNTIAVSVDGAVMERATDNRYLSSGDVGLWADRIQINIRSFRVVAL